MHGFDDGDATGDCGFEMDGSIVLTRKGEEFFSAFGEEGFVSGDDGFLCFQCRRDEVEGDGGATDQFDDEVDGRVFYEVVPVGGEQGAGGIGIARLGKIAHGDATDFELHLSAGAVGDEAVMFLENIPDSGTDGSKACQADADRVAGHGSALRWIGGMRNAKLCLWANLP